MKLEPYSESRAPRCQNVLSTSGKQCPLISGKNRRIFNHCMKLNNIAISEPLTMKTRKADWVQNQRKIREVYSRLLIKNSKTPTLREVAKASGFHVNTVRKHMNNKGFQCFVDSNKIDVSVSEVIFSVFSAALN